MSGLPEPRMEPKEDGYAEWYEKNYDRKLDEYADNLLCDHNQFVYDLAAFLCEHPAKDPMKIAEAARGFIEGTPKLKMGFDAWMVKEWENQPGMEREELDRDR